LPVTGVNHCEDEIADPRDRHAIGGCAELHP
jgi:hypothetical protein